MEWKRNGSLTFYLLLFERDQPYSELNTILDLIEVCAFVRAHFSTLVFVFFSLFLIFIFFFCNFIFLILFGFCLCGTVWNLQGIYLYWLRHGIVFYASASSSSSLLFFSLDVTNQSSRGSSEQSKLI